MSRTILTVVLTLLVAALLFGQRLVVYPAYEYRSVFPQEVTPARYRQVDAAELNRLALDGWELVSVTPYVYLNEERGPEGGKQVATQVYPAYFFKRLRPR